MQRSRATAEKMYIYENPFMHYHFRVLYLSEVTPEADKHKLLSRLIRVKAFVVHVVISSSTIIKHHRLDAVTNQY